MRRPTTVLRMFALAGLFLFGSMFSVSVLGADSGQLEADWLRQAAKPPVALGQKGACSAEVDAAGACDGLKNGKWGFHTDREVQPWWQVDLKASTPIDRVLVFNRCDSGVGAARRIMVLVSDDAKTWRKVYQHDGTEFRGQPDGKPLAVKLSGTKARFVRLQLPQQAFFYLDEVEIYAPGDKTNIALRKPVNQSSTSQWSAPPAPPAASAIAVTRQSVEDALDLARRTLAFVEQSAARPELAAELAAIQAKAGQLDGKSKAELESLYFELRRVRRRTILSHPLLAFDRLLINKRPPPTFKHQTDQYLGRYSGPGDGLVVLDSWKNQPKETVLLKGKLPTGSVLHPELSFDGRRILFSYCDHTVADKNLIRFFIYEIGVDGSGLRQVTGTVADPLEGFEGRQTVLIEDYDPCYLPDGGFAFVSTRNQGGVRCHHGGRYCPTYTLYRANLDGTGIRPLAYGEANEWDPSVLPDGRIIWTRWDYINRHDTLFQSLWTTRPDGTATAHFYGNYSRNPCSIAEARAIPGSRKVVATATAHHHYTAGSLIMIDPRVGQDGPEPITRITPEVAFPETEGWNLAGSHASPYPLSEELFLTAYSPEYRNAKPNDYGIYLIDTLGGRELIYRDPNSSCFVPLPIVPREVPPVLSSTVASTKKQKTGTFYVRDVYESTETIPPGSVKSLRVIRMYPQTVQRVPDRSLVLFETAKSILGTVPVAEDGSVAFRAPAGQPLMFQLLDENNMAVMSMRTFVYLQPGEKMACVGCHEPRNSTPARIRMPASITVHDPKPSVPPHYPGGISFARTVQPVLDRYCINCHGLEKTEAKLSLLGTMKTEAIKLGRVHGSLAYDSLTLRPGLVSVALRNKESDYSQPKDYFAHAGRLAKLLREGDEHHEKLDPISLQRVVDWLDLNAEFFGDYTWNKAEWRKPDPKGEEALRRHIRATFGNELAGQPFAALVNVSLPAESRILKAPLAIAAGGWGRIDKNGWPDTNHPGYQQMLRLVEGSIAPTQAHDICGTCNQTPCVCGGCWVRQARQEQKQKSQTQTAPPKKAG